MLRRGFLWSVALWALGGTASAAQERVVAPPAPAERVEYVFGGPARAAIAQAFEVELIVRHGPESAVRLDAANLSPERGWLLLDVPEGFERTEGPGQRATHFRLRAAPVATGGEVDEELRFQPVESLPWPELEVLWVPARGGDDVRERWTVPGFAVEVPSLLAADVAAPPAPLGLAALEAPPLPRPWHEELRDALGPIAAPAVAFAPPALLLLALLWARQRRRARAAAPVEPTATPRERVEVVLAKAPRCAADERRSVCFETAAALRAEVDARLGASRAALSEDEWLAALAGEPGGTAVAEPMAALLAASAAARWGAREPSVYALEEQVQLARAALSALDAVSANRGERAA
ncbi:MAG: hypothetical protein GC161_12565 [Planctomycetaceae bacterium]|nr:hypothetical protein [Planctomycetaceae bacterium]